MTPWRLTFGLWSLTGVVVAAVAAVAAVDVFAIPEQPPSALNGFIACYFLGSVVPFGALCVESSRIGLNYGASRVGDPKETYLRRLTQARREVVPVTGTLAIAVPVTLCVVSLLFDSGEGLAAGVLSLFYTLPACFFLRFLPAGDAVIRQWAAEETAWRTNESGR